MVQTLPVTPMVKKIGIATLAVWVLGQLIGEKMAGLPVMEFFALTPSSLFFEFYVWQVFSYMFLHSYGVFHILFNMLLLWWLGAELEQKWGAKFFLTYYLACGVGAAIIYAVCMAVYALIAGSNPGLTVPVVGASGAIYGLMMAYGMIFGERIIYFMMMFPMKAKHMVLLLAFIQIVSLLSEGGSSGVAYLAHLGGFVSGFLFLKGMNWSHKAKRSSGVGHVKASVTKSKTKLRLVVNNKDDSEGVPKDPKYWN